MENRPVRIRDIAEELGLSTATVSNVLHGKTGRVSDETVRRVQALLEERQYIPSMAGILLAQNSSRIIGVVLNDHKKYEGRVIEDVFISSSLNCLSTEIEREGLFMMVKKTTDPEEIIRFASMWNLEGLVLIGFCDEDYLYLRSHMRIPFVVYDGFCGEEKGICNITIDNYNGGRQVGEHFRTLGHTKALCVSDNCVCVDKERYEGFRDGFGNADLMLIPMHKAARLAFYRENLRDILEYTAVFAVSDFYAIELMHFLTGEGIEVPKCISIAGFDDTPLCAMVSPALTSVRQDVSARARIAVEKLRALKEHQNTDSVVKLSVSLAVRASTGVSPK